MDTKASCGADTMAYYSLEIFGNADVPIDEYVLSILVQAGFVAGYTLSTWLMTRVSRKWEFVSSGLLTATCMFLVSICMFAQPGAEGELLDVVKVSQPVLVVLSTLAYSLGYGPVLFSLLGGVFPARVKGVCCALVLAFR